MIRRFDFILAVVVALPLVAAPLRPAHAQVQPDPIATVVARVRSAVVRVISVRPQKPEPEKSESQMAKAAATDRTTTAIGSGFIIGPSGFVATNKHVVENSVAVYVANSDGVRYKATVVGATAKADIALLKIDAGQQPLPTVPFGDSDKMRVGDTVIAIGSPFGFDNSVTTGVVSAVNRDIMESPFDDYIQTDAPINHGNSGGPLFNAQGEVVGMNSVLFAPGDQTGSVGLGFAIPSNDLKFVFDRLMATGEIKAGMLPIRTQQVTWMIQQALGTPGLEGALVAALDWDGDKMMDGQIKPGDVILEFNGKKVWDPRDLARKAAWAPIGSDAELLICRSGKQQTVHVKVQAWPEGGSVLAAVSKLQQHLGLQLASESREGGKSVVMVAAVDPTGTAADSGIQKGDVVLQVQMTPVSDPAQALRVLKEQSFTKRPYSTVLVERNKERTWIPVATPE
jgi:serine protease Do